MPLDAYNNKRDFEKTKEPSGKVSKSRGGFSYLIQKHAASHLHYDFRLELDGVLLSWAVPKGPSLDPKVKRLAMLVEDHPVAYGSFEGTIPEGEYGGGTVMLWDRGTWEPLDEPKQAMRAGMLKFMLHGERLRGKWMLLQMKGPRNENGKSWLLVKEHDEEEKPEEKYSVTEKYEKSVVTNRTMEQIAGGEREWRGGSDKKKKEPAAKKMPRVKVDAKKSVAKSTARARTTKAKSRARANKKSPRKVEDVEGAIRAPLPEKFEPQLATLVDEPPTGDGWLHELKFDGYRMLVVMGAKSVRLITARKGIDWTHRFKQLAVEFKALGAVEAVIDGEAVVLKEDGSTSFQALQNALSGDVPARIDYFAFDLIYLGGFDLRKVRLVDRKALLQELLERPLPENSSIHFSEHIEGHGKDVLAQSCRLGMEGIISKRDASFYSPVRTRDWLKIKCTKRQEFVVGAWTKPGGDRSYFGALLLGYYDENDDFIYAGRLGTGFNESMRRELFRRMAKLSIDRSAFRSVPRDKMRDVSWVKPEIVVEANFAEWTGDGILRQPSFQGLREDKTASQVHREITMKLSRTELNVPEKKDAAKSQKVTTLAGGENTFEGVTITNPQRVLFPEKKITKLDLARYFHEVMEWVLPHLAERPLAVVRCPEGQEKDCFFQKHPNPAMAKHVMGVSVSKDESEGPHMYVRDAAGVMTLVQFGALEIHTWGCHRDNLEKPDQMIFDLDPDAGADWSFVTDGCLAIRDALAGLGLQSFVKTSGGKGLHVVVPLQRKTGWDGMKEFSHQMAIALERADPTRYLSVMSKAKRRGKVFVDYLRNGRGATCVGAYSSRAREHAGVSMPIEWSQVTTKLRPDQYDVINTLAHLAARNADPWREYFKVKQSLTATMMKSLKVG